MTEAQTSATPKRRQASKIGIVTSDKMDKSAVVRVDRTVPHKRYKRYIKRSAHFMVHDERNECKVGDTVEIVETRPLSARKRWRLRRVVRPAGGGSTTVVSGGQE
jgi:small subunit ribosomal protein S17